MGEGTVRRLHRRDQVNDLGGGERDMVFLFPAS